MRLPIVLHIFRKDLVETLRDRRTVVMAFVVPALIYPLLFTLLGSVASDKRGELERTRVRVAAWGPVPSSALRAVEQQARADIVDRREQPPPNPESEARALVSSKKVHVVLLTPAGAAGASVPIRVLSDSTDVDSDAMERRVSRALTDHDAELLRQRMTALGQDAAAAKPLDVHEEDLADAARRGASLAATLLPYLLLVLVATSGFYAALDLTAGEKERGTLQTLLTAPVRSVEIVAGKYLAVLALTLAATVCNLGSIALTLSRATAAIDRAARFSLGLSSAAAIFFTVLPAALLIVAILMAVGVLARSYREGQSYLMPILILVILAGFASFLPGAELTAGTSLIPLLNVTLLVHDLLVGKAGPTQVMVVWAVSLAWAVLGIVLTARVFQTEQVLLSGEKPWRDVLAPGSRTGRGLTPGNALAFAAVLLVVNFYGSVLFERRGGVAAMILGTQLGLMLLPSLLWCRVFKAPLRETLQLRLPSGRGWLGTVLLAAGGWSVGALVWSQLLRFPGARAYTDWLGELLGKQGQLGLGAALLLVALVPAVVEEVTFRGVVLAGLRRSGSRWIAIGGSALIFGLFHINPYHVVAATVVGLLLGWVALESGSIVPSILIHLVNNGAQVLLDRVPDVAQRLNSPVTAAVALAITAAGAWLVRGSRRPAQATAEPVPVSLDGVS
ncbi:MAG TPA: ABC transporter permease subunit/CPBP intramembrane protease [Myxococcaceae bacterium]|nr:ABC transporter permease subunit/CPBP intramembrane protease [Myxococcaceae bacterium]